MPFSPGYQIVLYPAASFSLVIAQKPLYAPTGEFIYILDGLPLNYVQQLYPIFHLETIK